MFSNNVNNNINKKHTEIINDENNYLSTMVKMVIGDKEVKSALIIGDKKKSDKISKINNNKNYSKYNYDSVKKMINDVIQLNNSIDIQSLFSILIINFNNKYVYTFDYKYFHKNIPQFSKCFKYYAIMIIPLIFLNKDEYDYKRNSSEAKIIFEKFIYITLDIIGQKKYQLKK